MTKDDVEQFSKMIESLSEYYGRVISPALIEVYWAGLERFELQDVRRAFNLHVSNADTGQFMPKIADVVKFIEGNKDTAAMEAWNKVARAIQSIGTYQSVEFNDKIIHSVIADMGGWPQMGLITNDELPFKIKEFERRYQGYLLRGINAEIPLLLGIFERENRKAGYDEDHTVLIDNKIKQKTLTETQPQGESQ